MLELLLGAADDGGSDATFNVVPNTTNINEGGTVEFTIYPYNYIPGKEYGWSVGGSIDRDHIDGEHRGTIVFNGNEPVTVSVKTLTDEFKGENETLKLLIHSSINSSYVIGSSPDVIVFFTTHPTGNLVKSTIGVEEWVVPDGVTVINAVCIGAGQGGDGTPRGEGGAGGDLRWRNKIYVVPGETLTLEVGKGGINSTNPNLRVGGSTSIKRGDTVILRAGGGGSSGESTRFSENVGGGNGGYGGPGGEHGPGGGGGCGGYSGNGGNGGNANLEPTKGEGGGGGGGAYYLTESNNSHHATAGGGVGFDGQGEDGSAGVTNDPMSGGGGGSGGSTGTWIITGTFGGGGRGQSSNVQFGSVNGANGALQLIWGPGREFPNG